jgi:hypothetical protein
MDSFQHGPDRNRTERGRKVARIALLKACALRMSASGQLCHTGLHNIALDLRLVLHLLELFHLGRGIGKVVRKVDTHGL